MRIEFKQASITDIETDLLVVNLFEGVDKPSSATGAVDEALDGLISDYVIKKEKFKGEFDTFYHFPTYGKIKADKVLVVGLGKSAEFDYSKLRVLASKIAKEAKKLKAKKVSTIVHGARIRGLTPSQCAQMIAEGAVIGDYSFDKYKAKKDNAIEVLEVVEINEKIAEDIKKGLALGEEIAKAVNFARDLVNEPASKATPSRLAREALGIGLECNIIDKDELKKLRMGAYLAVARGSKEKPKFIHLKYTPEGTPKKKIALVGKGVTFDSGGLNLKPTAAIRNMKDDMSGSAAVLGIMSQIAKIKPNVEVHGLVAACENMPSGKAYKPGDIITAMNGKTIEVDNTDAEGRLTLADAICYAEKLGVDEIIDIATLTGACMVALGHYSAGIMGNDDKMLKKLIKSAEAGGESFWQLPMFEEHTKELKSDVADLKNTGARYGGASSAGAFLKEFVDKAKWTHIDIAGPAFIDKDIKELSKGGTGAGVRAIINYLLGD